jgi:hypothetical protein
MMHADLTELSVGALGTIHSIETVRLESRVGEYEEYYGGCPVRVFRQLGEPYWNATEIVCDHTVVDLTVNIIKKVLGA